MEIIKNEAEASEQTDKEISLRKYDIPWGVQCFITSLLNHSVTTYVLARREMQEVVIKLGTTEKKSERMNKDRNTETG